MTNNGHCVLKNRLPRPADHRRGFTLVELLVVISVIAILCALSFAVLGRIRQSSRSTRCVGNLRQIYLASRYYSQEHNDQVLPCQSLNGSTKLFWHWILRPDLGGANVYDDKADASLRCMEIKSGSPYFWSWGYGANSKPGMEGASTSGTLSRYNWEQVNVSNPATWQGTFKQMDITHPGRRLFICDSKEWQVAASASGESAFPDYDRHGKGKCDVLFFDGHIGFLNKKELNKALYDPGS